VPLFHWVRTSYLNCSREVKRIEAISRSPVYALFSSTLHGLQIVRAYKVGNQIFDRFTEALDNNTRPLFAFFTMGRWLGFRLDFVWYVCACDGAMYGCSHPNPPPHGLALFVCSAMVVSVTALLAVGFSDSVGPSAVGFALTYALQLTALLQWAVRQSAEVENCMTSVERIASYSALPPEGPEIIPSRRPPANWYFTCFTLRLSARLHTLVLIFHLALVVWCAVLCVRPDKGEIVFDDYQMRYRPGLDLVLKGVNVTIRPGEKVGVCGRTGAGKSSLLQSLFRLVEPAAGRILIDGIDIASIGLADLRSKLAIIPQNPVLFSGTLRYNLDPFNQWSDEKSVHLLLSFPFCAVGNVSV
jgi:ATP-binding cassette subfamily C (CFTR/MRP) protein 1